MDIIGEVFNNLKARFVSIGLFTKVYGLVEQDVERKYVSYEGGGQGEYVQNFDNELGTVFFVKRTNVSINKVPSPVACRGMYSFSITVRAVGVLQKDQLPCDNATAGFQVSQGMLKEVHGFDVELKKLIGASTLEIVPVGFDDKLAGLDVGREYCVGVTDFNIVFTTNIQCLPGLCPVD